MKKLLVLFFCFALMLLAACSSSRPPTAEKIKEDLNASPDILPWVEIQNVEIVRSRTDEANRSMTADITFTGVDEYADYTGTMTLLYNLYDSGKWMIDDSEIEYDCQLTKLFEVDMESTDDSSIFQAHYMTNQVAQKYDFLTNCKNSLGVEHSYKWQSNWDSMTRELFEKAYVDIDCQNYSVSFDGTTATIDLLCDAQYPYMDVIFRTTIHYSYTDGSWLFNSVENIDFQDISFSKLEGRTFYYTYDDQNRIKITHFKTTHSVVSFEIIEIEYYDNSNTPNTYPCYIMFDEEATSRSDAIQKILELGYLETSNLIDTSLESRYKGYVKYLYLRNIQFEPFISLPRTTWDNWWQRTEVMTTHDFYLE